jgi:hypothetical protein
LTCSSRQARTQRVHWMQASRLTAIAGCEIVGERLRARREARLADAEQALPLRELRIGLVDALRHVGGEHLDDDLLRVHGARRDARHFHPVAGVRQQEGASTRSPLISTMQARQLPSGRMPGV